MTTRHMYDFPNNNASVPLCHNLLTGGALVRQMIATVNCEACIELWQRAQKNTRTILAKDLEDGMVLVGFMDKTARISRVRKNPKYVIFHNDTLELDDRLGLYDEVTVVVPEEAPEKKYLVCDCGEAFDAIETAGDHVCHIDEPVFHILPESEAL